jgi:hypothetical protein
MQLDRTTVENILLAWETAVGNGKQIVTNDLVDLWFAALIDERVSLEEFKTAAVRVIKGARFWPKPVEALDHVKAIRGERRAIEARQLMKSLVAVTDENGNPVAVPAGSLPAGYRPALPGPSRPKAEIIRSMKPGAAKMLIDHLQALGSDVSEERKALYQVAEEDALRQQEEAQQREVEQAARVKAQITAMKAIRE